MKFLNKYQKGEYEYASYNKKRSWIITVFLYVLSLSIYLMGYISTGSNKNLLTIVAVLGILPASKSLISAIMNSRVKTTDQDTREAIDSVIGNLTGMYNIYLTSYDINFYLVHLVVTSDSLICLSDDKNFDVKRFNEHLEKHMKIDGINNILIKVFDNKEAYTDRLIQLNNLETSVIKPHGKLLNLIKNISL